MPPYRILPHDILHDIVDQCFGDTEVLRNLCLASSLFFPRARLNLYYDVLLKSKAQLEALCAKFEDHPHLRPLIHSVRMLDAQEDPKRLSDATLLEVVPVPLFSKLPNLRTWSISSITRIQPWSISFNSSTLACLAKCTSRIQVLYIDNVHFLSCDEFLHLLIAFPAILRLECRKLSFERTVSPSDCIAGRLSTRLHLSHLETVDLKDNVLATILNATHRTLQYLKYNTEVQSNIRHPLYASLRHLALYPFSSQDNHDQDRVRLLEGVGNIIRDIRSPLLTHVQLHFPRQLTLDLAHDDLFTEPCRTLEQALLRPPLERVTFVVQSERSASTKVWLANLGRRFPLLLQQGMLKVEAARVHKSSSSGHDAGVRAVAVSRDSKWLATASWDNTIIIWNLQDLSVHWEWTAHRRPVWALDFSPLNRLASASYDRRLSIWDIGGTRLATLEGHTDEVNTCSWSPDGRLLVSGSDDHAVRVWDAQTFHCLCVLEGHSHAVTDVRFSPDGKWIASGSSDATCRVWDAMGRKLHKVLRGHEDDVNRVGVDSSSRRIATTSDDKTVRVWDIESGEELLRLSGHRGRVWAVAFSPDGQHLLSSSIDRTVILWDSSSGEKLRVLSGHDGPVFGACFSPDGKHVASASHDSKVRLWRVADGACLAAWDEHRDTVGMVVFSYDGETLCSGANDGSVCIRSIRQLLES